MMPCLRSAGASFAVIEPAGFRILASLDNATRLLGTDLVITCGTEDHPPEDPHTKGLAYDIRVRDLATGTILKLVTYLQQCLGNQYTVLLETPTAFSAQELVMIQSVNKAASGPHLHIQLRRDLVHSTGWPVPEPKDGNV